MRESIPELLYRDYLENKGADAQAITEKLNAVSRQLREAGLPDYPDDIMVVVVRACEEHEHAVFLAGLRYGAQLHICPAGREKFYGRGLDKKVKLAVWLR